MIPLVSIIIPVYNVEKYLQRCMDSIVNQTLREIEIICVNDGTKDNSVSILNEYAAKDDRIKIVHKKNGGLSSARNEGMKHAVAEYIGFVDSDDWIEPDTYELAYKAMTENNADLVCWYAQLELEDGLLENHEIQSNRDYHRINRTGLFTVSDDIFSECSVTAWNKLYKNSIIKKYNLFFPHGLLHEDVEFFFKYALMCQRVYFIGKYLTHYLQRLNSIMRDKEKNINKLSIDRIKIMERLYQYFIKYDIISKYKKTISKAIIWDCFVSDCWANSRRNQFYVYYSASRIVKKMDLTLLADSNDFLYNLNNMKFSSIFYSLYSIKIREAVLIELRKTLIYKILKKLYHQTNYYKIRTLQRQYNELEQRLGETNKWLCDTNDRIDDTNKRFGGTNNVLVTEKES